MVSTTFPHSLTVLGMLFFQSSYLVPNVSLSSACNSSLFPSTRTRPTLQMTLFANKHILDPGEARNRNYLDWKSKEWSTWLVERNRRDGILRGNHYGTILKGRNLSVIIGETAMILSSLKEINTTRLESSFGTREVRVYTSIASFNIYHFVRLQRAKELQEAPSNFVAYELFKLRNASFWVLKTIFGKERETVQLNLRGGGEDTMGEDFVIRVHFIMKKFDKMPAEVVQRIGSRFDFQPELGSNEQVFLATAHALIHKCPELFIRIHVRFKAKSEILIRTRSGNGNDAFLFSKDWGQIMSSIAAVRGEELISQLHKMTPLEKYVMFEIVKTVGGVTGKWSKFRLLSTISKSLTTEPRSGNSNADAWPVHSFFLLGLGIFRCGYVCIIVIVSCINQI